MRIIPLGTSSGVPTRKRNVPAFVVAFESFWVLIDCGEGTQHRLMDAKVKRAHLDAILITHLHADHVLGLPGFISTLGMQGRKKPLDVYGPPGIKKLLTTIIEMTEIHLDFVLRIHEVAAGIIRDHKCYHVECEPLVHRVTTFGYAIVEKDKPGRFDPEKAKALGVPSGPLFREIKFGRDVRLPSGKLIQSSEILETPTRGRRVAYCSDTQPSEGAVKLAKNADLLIHEATYSEDMSEKAHERGHSTAADAARIAKKARCKRLLLTHFSSRYLTTETLLKEAQVIFPRTRTARDLVEFNIPLHN